MLTELHQLGVCAPAVLVASEWGDTAAAAVLLHLHEAGAQGHHDAPVTCLAAAAGRTDCATAIGGKEPPLRDSDLPGQRLTWCCVKPIRVVLCKGLLPLQLAC